MTAFMESVLAVASTVTERTRTEYAELHVDEPPDWTLLERRFACVIIQARAQECRQQATGMVIHKAALLERVAPDIRLALSMAINDMSKDLLNRSHYLEQTAMDIAQGPWPPVEVEEPAPTGLVM